VEGPKDKKRGPTKITIRYLSIGRMKAKIWESGVKRVKTIHKMIIISKGGGDVPGGGSSRNKAIGCSLYYFQEGGGYGNLKGENVLRTHSFSFPCGKRPTGLWHA